MRRKKGTTGHARHAGADDFYRISLFVPEKKCETEILAIGRSRMVNLEGVMLAVSA
jgi:hypothetical protein